MNFSGKTGCRMRVLSAACAVLISSWVFSRSAPAAAQEAGAQEGTAASTQLDRLNKMLIRQAELQVERARRDRDRAWRLYNLYENLAAKDLISGKDLEAARQTYEDMEMQHKQVEMDLEKTKLDLLRSAIHISVVDAKKLRTEEGALLAEVTLLNNSNLARAKAVEEAMAEDEVIGLLEVESVVVCLCDGAIVSHPYETVIPSLAFGKSKTLTFKLLKDIEDVYVSLRYFDTEEMKRVTFRKESTRRFPRAGSAQFSQEGELGTTVEYGISLELLTAEERRFHLRAVGLPREMNHHFAVPAVPPAKFGPRITQVKFSDNLPSAEVTLNVAVPKSLSRDYVDKTLKFYAIVTDTAGLEAASELDKAVGGEQLKPGDVAGLEGSCVSLELIPRGVGKLDLLIPNRYQQITIGQDVGMTMEVRNTGTISVQNIAFDTYLPTHWVAALKPDFIKDLDPDQKDRIALAINPGEDVVVGEYDVRILARGEVGSTETESDEKTLSIRIEPRAKLLAAALLVGLILVLMVAIAVITMKVSRR